MRVRERGERGRERERERRGVGGGRERDLGVDPLSYLHPSMRYSHSAIFSVDTDQYSAGYTYITV